MTVAPLAARLCAHQDSPESLLAELCTAGFDRAAVAPPAAHRPYARLELLAADGVEVLLARWAPGATCAPHDHGGARGWVFFLEGDFVEHLYAPGPDGWRAVSSRLLAEGSVAQVHPELTHACTSQRAGLSLHVYFPRISGMKVHSLQTRQTFLMNDASGAWLPEAPADYVSVEPWPK